jgi:peptidoglycan-associated lipoprotein
MMIEVAEEQFELGEYFNAIEWFEKAYKEVRTADVALTVGYLHYKLKNYDRAENWYKRVLPRDEDNLYIDDRYVYGNVLKSLGRYDEAKAEYDKIIALSSNEELKDLSTLALKGIELAPGFEQNEDVVVRYGEGDINSPFQEFAPIQYDEGTLYFSSFQRRKEIVLDGGEKKYHSKIFTSTISDKGFSKPEALDRKINRDDYHTGNVTFSKDKRTMYFTRQLIQHNEVLSSVIYASDQDDEGWKAPEPLPSVNGDFIAKHPAVGELFGNEVLFFVSNMEGGQGGFDIFYSEINGGTMSAPVNLGETINTKGDEITPFYHDGTLYFSTDGRPSIGGFDIYQTEWDGESWSEPINKGHNFNSSYDDLYLTFSDKDSKGYLISNRPDDKKKSLKSNTCCDDIYIFDTRRMLIDLLVGVGTEEEKPLLGATVDLYDLTITGDPNSQTQPEEYRFNYDLEGDHNYRIITSRDGYIADTTEFNTFGIMDTYTVRKKVILKKLQPEPEEPEYETVTINQEIRLNNIYYDFDKWDILPESEEDLSVILQLMFDYPDMVIELSSHTDSRGITNYNEDLSQKRAESAKNWLVEREVVAERIKAVGYGESQILNGCTNGVRCTEEEHRFNRRTQFKIIAGPQSIQIDKKVLKTRVKSFYKERDPVPVITFDTSFFDLGDMITGEKKDLIYKFTNTGEAPLKIDLVTSCKCTDTMWPKDAVMPGEQAEIRATFDSAGMKGEYNKTIDIIANTDPIVVEAKFKVRVLGSSN